MGHEPDRVGADGGADAVYVPAHARDGWADGGQTVYGTDLGVGGVWRLAAHDIQVKSASGPRRYCASCYAFCSDWRLVGTAGRAGSSPPHRGTRESGALAQGGQCHVFWTVGVCTGGVRQTGKTLACSVLRVPLGEAMKQALRAFLLERVFVFPKKVLPKSRVGTFTLASLLVTLSFGVTGMWSAFSMHEPIALPFLAGSKALSVQLTVNGLPNGPLVAGQEYWLSYHTEYQMNAARGRIEISVDSGGHVCRHFSWDSEVEKGPGRTGFSPGRPLYVPNASEGVTVMANLFVDGNDAAVVSSEVKIPVERVGDFMPRSLWTVLLNIADIGIPFFRK